MPNKINLTSPPTLRGEAGQQLQQIWPFLYQTVEQLNVCLNSIDEDNLAVDVREKLNTVFDLTDELEDARAAASGKTGQLDKATQTALTDTQDTLQANMDSVEQTLSDSIAVNAAAIDALEERTDALEAKDFDDRYSLLDHTHDQFIDYTEDEQDTGYVWIDGSTLYRKSFTWTGSATGQDITIGSIGEDILAVVDIRPIVRTDSGNWRNAGFYEYYDAQHTGTVTINTDGGSGSDSYTYYRGGIYSMTVYVNSGGNVILHAGNDITVTDANVTIWYTK